MMSTINQATHLLVIPKDTVMLDNFENWYAMLKQSVSTIMPGDRIIIIADVIDYGDAVARQLSQLLTLKEDAIQIVERQNERFRKLSSCASVSPFIFEPFLEKALRETIIKKKLLKWQVSANVMEHYTEITRLILGKVYKSLIGVDLEKFPIETLVAGKRRAKFTFENINNQRKLDLWQLCATRNSIIAIPSIGKCFSGVTVISGQSAVIEFKSMFKKAIDNINVITLQEYLLV